MVSLIDFTLAAVCELKQTLENITDLKGCFKKIFSNIKERTGPYFP
jgi:hypothetical protein